MKYNLKNTEIYFSKIKNKDFYNFFLKTCELILKKVTNPNFRMFHFQAVNVTILDAMIFHL